MELMDTVDRMNSTDYKERFRAEYFQLKIRAEKLSSFLEKMSTGTLAFKPACSFELLSEQNGIMYNLLNLLEKRAEIEDITLLED